MTSPDLLALVRQTSDEELPALIGGFEAAKAAAWVRLTTPVASRKTNGQEDRLLNMPAVASFLGIPEDRARDLGRRGELPVVEIGKYRRVRLSALMTYIAARESKGFDRARIVGQMQCIRGELKK